MSFLALLVLLSAVYTCNCFSLKLPSKDSSVSIRNRRNKLIEHNEGREYCSGCNRPPIQCLCSCLPTEKIALNTQVLILQHPVEFRRKTVSTVPLLSLTLELCKVLVGRSFDVQLESIIDDACSQGRIPILLFPGPDAICLEDPDAVGQLQRAHHGRNLAAEGQKEEMNDDGLTSNTSQKSKEMKCILIIVDGTWTQAKRMLRNSPLLLERCHSIQFTGTTDLSIYGSIRKQPEAFCLSTLESCARTLSLLEPDNPQMKEATGHLYESLKALVRVQMEQEKRHLEENPDLIRDVPKLVEKLERQKKLFEGSKIDRITEVENKLTQTNPDISSKVESQTVAVGKTKGNDTSRYTLRPLKGLKDAEYVDAIWPYRSKKSLKMIERQISADNNNATMTGNSVCLGIEHKGNLVGCILRHRNGSLGILHVDIDHRRCGLGAILLKEATRSLINRGEPVFAFIVDGNYASEALFKQLGWRKADPSAKKGTGKRKAKRSWIYEPSTD